MYYVYVLQSLKDDKLYIGQTNNLQSRVLRHRQGYVKSTRYRRPLKLIFHKQFESRSNAMRFEKYLKSGAGHSYLKELIGRHGSRMTRS